MVTSGATSATPLIRRIRGLANFRFAWVTCGCCSGGNLLASSGSLQKATSVSLAALLLGRFTSPTQAAQRAEMQIRLQEVINAMDPIDREVLTLRHFEELSNVEAAQILGIQPSAASNRYLRAVKRLQHVFRGMPGGLERIWG